ncbi:tripartite motif-containing protein 60-like [Myotis lucifugus]|uniref:tripartite motif-containing protein 60-like n=1 Tax=Myotis lucifugus TaxID=59463 RepID=UPI0003C48CAD|nr:tripartite motif-containing protein 60-like [Myotis lucifugus]
MAFAASLAELQAEASCPICLDYLRDPVTIACGHNFCPFCIHQRWEGLQGTFPCPVCLHHCPDRSLERNTQLCHITEIVQQIPTSGSQRKLQEDIPLCGKHHEVLTLFCEKDLELLCAQCKGSLDPQDQPLIPIEEAAASQRGMLKRYMATLPSHFENVEKAYDSQVANTCKVKEKMGKWREEFDYECKELNSFLEIEFDEIDNHLLREENDVAEKLIENGKQISYHMFRLNILLSEIEEKCLQTHLGLLTGIERIHNSYGNLETPAVFSCELPKEIFTLPPHYLGLHKMIRIFQVDLTLDPETAHLSLIISRDRKSVTYCTADGLPNPQALTSYAAVLSSEGFDAGRHFWVVNIGGTGLYYLGVCKASFPRNTFISPSASNGCWQHQLCNHTGQRKIGVFLDYELGEVSFYNLNNWTYMFRIADTFTEKIIPYFSIASSSESLSISISRVYDDNLYEILYVLISSHVI